MGSFMASFRFQFHPLLPSAVNSSGAVSPDMRATASSTPVMMPARAAFQVTDLMTKFCGAPSALAFGRNADGSTNSCLFVIANASYNALPMTLAGRLDELNPSAVSDPGCPAGAPPAQVSIDDAVHELLHPGGLSAQQLTALDQQGNNNGRYDIGDLRAFLIANGALATRVKIAP